MIYFKQINHNNFLHLRKLYKHVAREMVRLRSSHPEQGHQRWPRRRVAGKLSSKAIFSFIIFIVTGILFFSVMSGSVFSQQTDVALERRVKQLENYVATFQPTIVELSENLNASIQEYTKGLESSLESYSQKLQTSLDERVNNITRKVIVLNPFSKAYQSIETNTGNFLISVEKVESIEGGVRLHLNIGNPNYADYQNFKLKLIWGEKWADGYGISYQEWRRSLNGVEYTFQGKIEKGKWNAITVDLVPTEKGQLGYLECEMNVSSVELGFN